MSRHDNKWTNEPIFSEAVRWVKVKAQNGTPWSRKASVNRRADMQYMQPGSLKVSKNNSECIRCQEQDWNSSVSYHIWEIHYYQHNTQHPTTQPYRTPSLKNRRKEIQLQMESRQWIDLSLTKTTAKIQDSSQFPNENAVLEGKDSNSRKYPRFH